jgi:5-formyltetrahydrofolate cyclo-ligase
LPAWGTPGDAYRWTDMDKQMVRERAWAAIRAADAARFPGVEGRIPNFVGAEAAAGRLAQTKEWKSATTLKCNPDSPQLSVRKQALIDGKTIYMAVPKLADRNPFWRLDPGELTVTPHQAASIKGASRHGRPVSIEDMGPIELVVCGSVAVERAGARLGKGGGYSDLEFAIATEAGLIRESTVIATTVHRSQIFEDGTIPVTDHDFPVDLIVTPEDVLRTGTTLTRPTGILEEHLDASKRETIPVLRR